MKIQLKKLLIRNFKGIKTLEIDFKDRTNIEGANRTGKSTIFDSFNWLLFGKTADDRKDFNIKPLDKKNKVIPMLENEVTATIDTDGREIKIKRTYREKWIQKRGESEKTFTGNETIYEWNDVPLAMNEFKSKIEGLVDENLFKLVTNPLFFNSLHWEKRRNMLISLIDENQIDYFVGIEENHKEIITQFLNQEKDLTDAKKELSSKIRKIKEEIELIPSRIDEAERAKPEARNWDEIEKQLATKMQELGHINNQLTDISSKFEEQNKVYIQRQSKKTQLHLELVEIEGIHNRKFSTKKEEIQNKISDIKKEVSQIEHSAYSLKLEIDSIKLKKEQIETQKDKLLAQYKELVASDFTWDKANDFCDKCGQSLPNSDELIENARLKFFENKESKLESIKKEGLAKKSEIEQIENDIKLSLQETIEGLEKNITEKDEKLEALELQVETFSIPEINDSRHNKLKEQIEQIDKELAQTKTVPENSELKEKASKLQSEIDGLKSELTAKETIKNQDKRIKQLKDEEKAKSQEIANLQKQEFAIKSFTMNKMTIVEKEVNKLFELVEFKLFEQQINGGEKEACITLVNGVPYPDVNTEGKINAGLDIINVFSEKNNIYAPIFIDNRESVTEIIPVNTQVINLIVNENEKQLKIS